MYYLKKFADSAAYRSYLASDEQWRPSVAYVVNTHQEDIDETTGQDGNMDAQDWYMDNPSGAVNQNVKRYVDFQKLGQHFIEVFNDGTMYFWTMKNATRDGESIGTFDASVDSEGSLNISVPTNSSTVDGSTWYSMNDNTGELNFWNFPEYKPGVYRWID